MDLPMILLGTGSAVLLLSLLHCFFGYKLARFLLPVCGVVLIEASLYIFVYETLMLDALGTWLLFAGSGLAVYIALFFFKRVAAFFTGLLGAAMVLVYAVFAFSLHGLPLLFPICLTLCVLSGLLTAVYQRVGVVISTALFGGCAAAFAGLFLYFEGIDPSRFMFGNLFLPLEAFLVSRIYLTGGVAAALALLGIALQFRFTGRAQVLESRFGTGEGIPSNTADMV